MRRKRVPQWTDRSDCRAKLAIIGRIAEALESLLPWSEEADRAAHREAELEAFLRQRNHERQHGRVPALVISEIVGAETMKTYETYRLRQSDWWKLQLAFSLFLLSICVMQGCSTLYSESGKQQWITN